VAQYSLWFFQFEHLIGPRMVVIHHGFNGILNCLYLEWIAAPAVLCL
jgi:hypothetical protein